MSYTASTGCAILFLFDLLWFPLHSTSVFIDPDLGQMNPSCSVTMETISNRFWTFKLPGFSEGRGTVVCEYKQDQLKIEFFSYSTWLTLDLCLATKALSCVIHSDFTVLLGPPPEICLLWSLLMCWLFVLSLLGDRRSDWGPHRSLSLLPDQSFLKFFQRTYNVEIPPISLLVTLISASQLILLSSFIMNSKTC